MPQPPYSPELAPADFSVFSKLKTPMKGKRLATIEVIKATGAVGGTKKCVSEILAGISVLYLRGVILKGTLIVIDK